MTHKLFEYKAYKRTRRALVRDKESLRSLAFRDARDSRDVAAQQTIAVITRATEKK